MQDRCRRHLVEQSVGGGAVRHLATGQQKGDRTAGEVGERVDFRGSPSTGPAYRLIALPPLPPDAQRWAFTAVLSIKTWAGGPPAEARA